MAVPTKLANATRATPPALRHPSGLGGPRGAPAPEEVDGPDQERRRDRVVEVVDIVPYPPPVLAEHVPEVRKREDPRDATEQRVDRELGEVHPRRASREGDERAHDGQAAGDEDRKLPVAVEPPLGDVQVVGPNAHVLAVAEPQLPPAPQPDEVGDPGPYEVPEDPGRHCCR